MSQLAGAPVARTNLPAELTDFVGRRQDRADVRRLLAESRLVTLTGMGGVGKTRLALQVARELQRTMPDGVWLVQLAELFDPAMIPQAVATVLGIHDRSSEFGQDRLTDYLRGRDLLLVLDNCEHLIDACAAQADALLRACPRLRILATSREPLRIAGEAIRPIGPFAVPHSASALATLQDYEAVRFFVDRARQVVPGFNLDGENRSAVVEVCRHLEGIPLALELAATRLRAMSPAELLERLRDHWELLDQGNRYSTERHRTMSACIGWSYDQCSPSERQLWDHLSVFAGAIETDAIQHVAAQGASATLASTADLVQALVDKSVLTAERLDGRTHFRMHEVLRQYGRANLTRTGSETSTRAAMLAFYTDLLARIDIEWMGPRQIGWMLRLRREEGNLRVALEFSCTEPGEAHLGLTLAARLRKYAMVYGAFTAMRHWLRRLSGLVPEPGMVRLRGVRAECILAALQGDRDASAALASEARSLADRLPAPATWLADQATGWHLMFAGEHAASVESLERTIAALADGGETRDIAETHTLLGMARAFDGDLSGAAAAHEMSLEICEASGESWCRSFSLWHLGLVVWAGGDRARAIDLERQSLELKRRMDEGLGLALCLEACAWMQAEEDTRGSVTLLGAADRLWQVMATSLDVLPGLTPLRKNCETALRESLGTEQFDASYAVGHAMDQAAAIAYALHENPSQHPASAEGTQPGVTALTKREQQVAELVATGLTNQEIATRLTLSRRTVEGHVEHSLTKLGLTSRTQLAVWVRDASRP